ncbi:MAG: fatty acid desaturase [Planctomycetota bacterium]
MSRSAAKQSFAIPYRLNLLIVAVQLVSIFGVMYLAARAEHWWQLALLAMVFAVVGNSVYSIIHEAEHRMLHPNKSINDGLGMLMALFFPAPYHLLRQGHLCHHRANRSDDEAFDLYFEGDSPLVKWLKYYGIITGVYWVMVVLSNFVVVLVPFLVKRQFYEFDKPFAKFMDVLEPRYWLYIRLEALSAILLHAAIIWSMGIPLLNYAVVYLGFGFSWSAMQYVHHFDTARHVTEGTRNLWICPPIDALWLHHNWHLIHHQQPTVPWIYLPTLAKEQESVRGFLPWFYLKMWRGPRYTDEHVENRFSGRVSN